MATKLLDAPMAVASDGTVLVSFTHVSGTRSDPRQALEDALRSGRPIYIGIVLSHPESAAVFPKLDNALAEIVALVAYRERG